jgi:tetratricopeptide (TPR) repeat protein
MPSAFRRRRGVAASFALVASTAASLGGCRAEPSPPPPDPSRPLVLFAQARLASLAGDATAARVRLEEAAALAPDDEPLFVALGEARLACGDEPAAHAAFDRAVELDRDDPTATVWLARLDLRAKRPADALVRLLALDERRPGDVAVLELVHPLLLYVGESERGLALFERALARAPELALAHEARADFLSLLGRESEALASYRRALALEPGRRTAEFKIAHLLERQSGRAAPRVAAPARPGVGVAATPNAAPVADH